MKATCIWPIATQPPVTCASLSKCGVKECQITRLGVEYVRAACVIQATRLAGLSAGAKGAAAPAQVVFGNNALSLNKRD